MSIFSRLADIVNANVTTLLDRAEDPAKMIRLMLQEMEDTLVDVRASAAKAIADKKEIARNLRRLRDAEADWQRRAELALSKGREDLAKGALVEKAKLAEMGVALEEELAMLDEALARQEEDIVKLEAKLREVRAKQKSMLARQESASNRVRVRRQVHDSRIEQAFARFEQMERRLDETEGEAEAYEMGGRKTLADEIADLETDDAVQAELEALKARLDGAKSTGKGSTGKGRKTAGKV